MKKEAGLHPREEKFQDSTAGREVQVEGAIDEFEMFDATAQQLLHFGEKGFDGKLPDRNIQRR